ncbi:hypothetical protein A3K24_02110 [candidate division Kazan bacterium RIFCSPHIGHO2_01_FULL_44_14]|uniref:Uncharacterized protein n=1 Tax=candidate division Kazan bacterium RIFCSPLOWO2_01_FULL_45_19 TaxID=1798538 RepID=A0A1F4NQD8_UNCK3|nr:hypothetical protein [uncultured bacterium]OGB73620.1 MAG: hypothetical protein A3K51_02110 [candidate division Kazan bacterium RIFCSPLOWO2_01_FULL_45_19]OGB77865.1 MAG: hypothetical protein A3K24_02110 [candidate division Kazan bacterium RIFCSPHIGHO2_01_FULL_44_14]
MFMVKLRNLFALFLLLGLVFAEVLPAVRNYQPAPAHSQSTQSDVLASLLQNTSVTGPAIQVPTPGFLDIHLPDNPAKIGQDAKATINLVYRPADSFYSSPSDTLTAPTASYFLSDRSDTEIYQPSALAGILPPANSDLAYAYQDGGRAWYQKGTNVLVIFSNDIIRSFNTKTGDETTWLQDRLAYAPIQDVNAIANYQTNYNAEIVAETRIWVLMEFPSGGVLKVARPQYANQSTGGSSAGTTYNLPSILPGYGN